MPIIIDRKNGRTASIGVKGASGYYDEQDLNRIGGCFRRRNDEADMEWRRAHYEIPAPLITRLFESELTDLANLDYPQPLFMNGWQNNIVHELADNEELSPQWDKLQISEEAAALYKEWTSYEKDLAEIRVGDPKVIGNILRRNGVLDKFWARKPVPSKYPNTASHQEAGVAFFLRSLEMGGGHICLFDEMRTGKTKQAIDIARYLIQKDLIKRVLIICTNSIKKVWQNELMLDSPDYGWLSTVIEGTKAKKEDAWKSLAFFYIINYEGARADKEQMYKWQEIHQKDGWMLICDESHKIKNPLAKQTRAIMGLNPTYSLMMTGTPVANRPEDAFCMTDFVCPGLLGANLEQFYSEFATRGGYNGKAITGYHKLDEITHRLSKISLRRKREDIMFDVTIRQDRSGTMIGDQLKAYNEMRDLLWTEITNEKGEFTAMEAQNNLVKILRLQQITSGYLPKVPKEDILLDLFGRFDPTLTSFDSRSSSGPQGKDDVVWFDNNWKLKELDEFVDEYLESIGKLVIWSRYVPPLEMLHDRYGEHGTAMIKGGMKSDYIFNEMTRFNNDPECRIMVCNILSAEGKGFPAADFHWFWDKWWSPHLNKQAQDRTQGVAKLGEERPTTVISAITDNAIDERLEYILDTKQSWSDQMLGDEGVVISVPKMDKNSLLWLIAKPEEAEQYKKKMMEEE
jgi:SNF2 family DNA or RNA helicase